MKMDEIQSVGVGWIAHRNDADGWKLQRSKRSASTQTDQSKRDSTFGILLSNGVTFRLGSSINKVLPFREVEMLARDALLKQSQLAI